MYISEILKILNNRRSLIVIFFLLLLPFLDLFFNWYAVFWDYLTHLSAYKNGLSSQSILHPSKAAFLSGSSLGHATQMLMIWLFPLYFLIAYGDFLCTESKVGYSTIIVAQVGKRRYMKIKFVVSFVFSCLISLLSLVINYLLSCIIFRNGSSFMGLESFSSNPHSWLGISITHPYVVYSIYILLYAFITGLYSVFIAAVSFIFRDRKWVYTITFFIWIMLILSPFSLTYLMQPYIEYGIAYMVKALLVFLTITLSTIIVSYYFFGGKDELSL